MKNFQTEKMGVVVELERFLDAYVDKNGMPPLSYFMHEDIQLHGTVPDIASINLFLHKGEIWAEPPWKRATFIIPESGRQEAAQNFLRLWPGFVDARSMTNQLNHAGRIIGTKFMLFGTPDERGRPIVEGFMEHPGEVSKINYLRRKVVPKEQRVIRQPAYTRREVPTAEAKQL